MQTLSQKFQQSIQNGTGKAVLLLKENPTLDVDEHILHACTHNLAYDPQCEESRAAYLLEIINLAHAPQRIIDTVLEQLLSPQSTDWDLDQLVNIAGAVAKSKSTSKLAAIKAIFVRYKKNLNPDYENIFSSTLIDIAKLKGLEFVAEINGQLLAKDEDFWIDDSDLNYFAEKFPNIDPRAHLKKLAALNEDIKRYVENLPSPIKEKTSRKRNKHTLIQLLNKIDSNLGFSIFAGRNLCAAELQILTQLIPSQPDVDKLQAYLRILANSDQTIDISNILPVLESSHSRTQFFALRILSKVKDSRIRQLLDTHASDTDYLYKRLQLYTSNMLASDLPTISKLASSLNTPDISDDDKHSFTIALRSIIEQNQELNFGDALKEVDAFNNCSICREGILRAHLTHFMLDAALLKEMLFDCEPDIRKLASTATSSK